MEASRWEWCGAKSSLVRRCRLAGMAANAASRSSKTKRAPLCSGALSITAEEAYFFFVVVLVVDAIGVVLAVVSIFMPVSIAAGAGAIAGAEVSAVAASSFLDVHAASARTAATRARRFIYDLLERQTWKNSPVRARGCSAGIWRGRKFISSGTRVKGNAC